MSDAHVYIHLIAEGSTEQDFIEKVLKPEFSQKGIGMTVSLLGRTGGNIKFARLTTYLKHFKVPCHISTMFDFFRIDSQWPGMDKIKALKQSKTQLSPEEKAKILEEETTKNISQNNFIPYIQMHEFEALLFSQPAAWNQLSTSAFNYIQDIVKKYPDPEAINDGGETAPSKRVIKNIKPYDKRIDGISIAKEIGLTVMREKCSHFNQWLTRLEGLKPLS